MKAFLTGSLAVKAFLTWLAGSLAVKAFLTGSFLTGSLAVKAFLTAGWLAGTWPGDLKFSKLEPLPESARNPSAQPFPGHFWSIRAHPHFEMALGGWLAGWQMAGWLAGWQMAGWLAGWLPGWLAPGNPSFAVRPKTFLFFF